MPLGTDAQALSLVLPSRPAGSTHAGVVAVGRGQALAALPSAARAG
jgi:hypothetical protein